MTEADIPGLMQWMNEGFAVVLIVVGIFLFVRFATWIGTNVITPIKDAHLVHLKTVDTCMKEQSETLRQQGETMKVQTEILKALQIDIAFIKTHVGRSNYEATS